jgi:hypothetical protein
MGALESTKGKDYIMTVSVQGHGEYPTYPVFKDPQYYVTSKMASGYKYGWEYYMEEIHEMDNFIKALTDELSSYDEPVVLVMYGDHEPALGQRDNDIVTGNSFDTQYVMWSNFPMKREYKDLQAYQLAAYVQKRVGLRQGTMTLLHQDKSNSKNYQNDIHMLMYDMLYGKKYIYGGTSPYKPTDMKMGFDPIKIDQVVEMGGEYYIKGENFTPFSKVTLDGKILDTSFIGPTVLKLNEQVDPKDASKMQVSQVGKYNDILSTTDYGS